MMVWYGWSQFRERVFERDRYRCVKCDYYGPKDIFGNVPNLVADHIVPIALGGPEWDMANIQTLCVRCNKIKTASDAKLMAAARAQEKTSAALQGVRQQHRPLTGSSPAA